MSKLIRSRRSKVSLAALALAAVVGSLVVTGVGTASQGEGEEKPPIVQHMEKINRNYKLLRRSARRPGRLVAEGRRERYLGMIVDMQSHMLAAMHEEVPEIQKAPTEQREKLSIRFKKIQADLIKQLLDLEIALLEKDTEKVKTILSKMAELKETGHDEFVPN